MMVSARIVQQHYFIDDDDYDDGDNGNDNDDKFLALSLRRPNFDQRVRL